MALVIFPYLFLSLFLFNHSNSKAYKLRRVFVNFAIFILGIRIEIEGSPIDKTALYVCNHRSFSDPVILLKYLDAYVIAKAEVANMPMIHTGAKLTGIIYVQRDDKASRTAVRQTFIKTIKEGLNVLVYPEGTTNPNRDIIEYRPGTFIEAAKNKIPVVPAVLEYKDEKDIWFNRGLFSQFFRQFGHLFTYTKLSIGPEINDNDGIKLRDLAQDWSQAKLEEMHKGWNSYFEENDTILK